MREKLLSPPCAWGRIDSLGGFSALIGMELPRQPLFDPGKDRFTPLFTSQIRFAASSNELRPVSFLLHRFSLAPASSAPAARDHRHSSIHLHRRRHRPCKPPNGLRKNGKLLITLKATSCFWKWPFYLNLLIPRISSSHFQKR